MVPIVNATEVEGTTGVNVPLCRFAEVTAYVPEVGMFAETMANLMDPSGHLFLTSVWVGRLPTCNPDVAQPWGTACPKVDQPAVNPTVPTVPPLACSVAFTFADCWETLPAASATGSSRKGHEKASINIKTRHTLIL